MSGTMKKSLSETKNVETPFTFGKLESFKRTQAPVTIEGHKIFCRALNDLLCVEQQFGVIYDDIILQRSSNKTTVISDIDYYKTTLNEYGKELHNIENGLTTLISESDLEKLLNNTVDLYFEVYGLKDLSRAESAPVIQSVKENLKKYFSKTATKEWRDALLDSIESCVTDEEPQPVDPRKASIKDFLKNNANVSINKNIQPLFNISEEQIRGYYAFEIKRKPLVLNRGQLQHLCYFANTCEVMNIEAFTNIFLDTKDASFTKESKKRIMMSSFIPNSITRELNFDTEIEFKKLTTSVNTLSIKDDIMIATNKFNSFNDGLFKILESFNNGKYKSNPKELIKNEFNKYVKQYNDTKIRYAEESKPKLQSDLSKIQASTNPTTENEKNRIKMEIGKIESHKQSLIINSVGDIPFYFVCKVGKDPHHIITILVIGSNVYSFGYGYASGATETQQKKQNMYEKTKLTKIVNIHVMSGGIYTFDHLVDIFVERFKYPIVDFGILTLDNVSQIQDFLNKTEKLELQFGFLFKTQAAKQKFYTDYYNNDKGFTKFGGVFDDALYDFLYKNAVVKIESSILTGEKFSSYHTFCKQPTAGININEKQYYNCTSFVGSIFSQIKCLFTDLINIVHPKYCRNKYFNNKEIMDFFERFYGYYNAINQNDGFKEMLIMLLQKQFVEQTGGSGKGLFYYGGKRTIKHRYKKTKKTKKHLTKKKNQKKYLKKK
jgi:hypothetical protein